MCGLFGVYRYGKAEKKEIALNTLIESLAYGAAVRGTHATGLSYVKDGNVVIDKAPSSSYKFKGYTKVPADVRAVIGHTRHTTQGSEKDNFNNHPFPGKVGKTSFSFAHNGVLDNDYELSYTYKLPKTKIKTDSYVAVQLLERNKRLAMPEIVDMAQTVEGMFAFTLLTNKNELYIIKNDSPMNIVHFPSLRMYVYASTSDILHDALFEFKPTQDLVLSVLKGQQVATDVIEYIDIKQGDILHFKQDGSIITGNFKPTERYSKYTNRHNTWLKQQANGGTVAKTTTTTTSSYGYNAYWDENNWYGRSSYATPTTTSTTVATADGTTTTEGYEYRQFLKNYAYTLGYEASDIDVLYALGVSVDEIENALHGYELDDLINKYTKEVK